MSLPKVAWRFASDGGTVTATSAAEGYQASNLLLPNVNVGQAWKSTGAGATERIVFDLGQTMTINAFLALGHDLLATFTNIKIEANTSDSWGAPAFSQAVTWRAGSLVEFFANQDYRYWSLVFTKDAAATIATIARACFGSHYTFTRGASARSVEWGGQEDTRTQRTAGGSSFSDVAAHLDTRRFKVEGIAQEMRDELEAMSVAVGLHTPIFLTLDHDSYPVSGAIYGKLARKPSFRDRRWTSEIIYDTDLEIVEEK